MKKINYDAARDEAIILEIEKEFSEYKIIITEQESGLNPNAKIVWDSLEASYSYPKDEYIKSMPAAHATMKHQGIMYNEKDEPFKHIVVSLYFNIKTGKIRTAVTKIPITKDFKLLTESSIS